MKNTVRTWVANLQTRASKWAGIIVVVKLIKKTLVTVVLLVVKVVLPYIKLRGVRFGRFRAVLEPVVASLPITTQRTMEFM